MRELIKGNARTIFVSAASAWEVAAVTIRRGQRAGALPGHHRDPFDRMLIAQAILEDCALVSNDAVFDRYGVVRLW